ncbi:hypothetical protein [uncultured Desulfuromonas sp.]|uniref:hypothetical protein n=1 Tax=uncultured Desulfuromonas sp. TaxID=181013 RepID=UPI002AAA65EC|nr:hypothetical protein [uncultured Desulfuromonas sp.]
MDLATLNTAQNADTGIEIEIFHPTTGEPIGLTIMVLGSDSQAYIDAERKINKRRNEQAKRTRDLSAGLDYDQLQAAVTEKMVACFVNWKTADGAPLKLNGTGLESSKDNFRKVITDRGFFWLRQQVQQAMDNVANFLPSSASSSSPQPSSDLSTTDQTKTE